MQPWGGGVPFVGRDAPLAVLREAVAAAGRGEPVVAVVTGEPGIGKTRLVTELTARADVAVLWGSCSEDASARPYWPWRQVVRGMRDHPDLAPLPAGAADGSLAELLGLQDDDAHPADARFRLFDAVADVIAGASRATPLLVVIDDVQWADEDSLQLLDLFARDRRLRRVLVVVTSRPPVEHDSPHALLLGALAGRGPHVALAGITEAEVAVLAAALDAPAEAVAHEVHHRSGGNPLYAIELLRSQAPGRSAQRALPLTLRAAIARRVAEHGAATGEILQVAAVLTGDVDVGLLAEVTGRDDPPVRQALDDAVRAGLLASTGPATWRFAHDVVRDVLSDTMDPTVRRRLHARAADVLAGRSGADADVQVAFQTAAGAVVGPGAVERFVRAARRCTADLAHAQAAGWWRRALEAALDDAGPVADAPAPGDLALAWAESELAAGNVPAAREAAHRAAAHARSAGDSDLLARAAMALGGGTHGFEVPMHDAGLVAALDEALDAIGDAHSSTRARLMAMTSVALAGTGSDGRRRSLAADAIELARRVGDRAALGHALAAHCDVIAGPAHSEAREAAAGEVVELGRALADRPLELLGRRLRLVARLERGDVVGADEDRARFAEVARLVGSPAHRWYAPLWAATFALLRGDLETASAHNRSAAAIGDEAHSVNAFALCSTQRWVIERAAGRHESSALEMRELLGLAPGATPLVSGVTRLRMEAVIAAQLGDLDVARARLDALLPAWSEMPADDAEWLPETAQLAEVAALAGHRPTAEVLIEALAPFADRTCVEGIGAAITGSVHWFVSMLASTLGDADAAAAHGEAALRAHRALGLVGEPPPLGAAARPRAMAPVAAGSRADEPVARLRLDGVSWTADFAGRTRTLRDGKGVRDLVRLVRRAGAEVHCLELAGGAEVGGDVGPALDDQARRQYQARILELQADAAEARDAADPARAERAEAELDALVEQLAGAFGLGGRARRGTGSASERARSAVTARIRSAIRQISTTHPELGRHLEHSVRTGTWCRYAPELPVRWEIDDGAPPRSR